MRDWLQASELPYGSAEIITKVFLTPKPSHAFDKYLLSSYCEPGTVVGTKDTMIELGEKLVNR